MDIFTSIGIGIAKSVIQARLAVPTADKQKIVDAANENLPDDKQIDVEQGDAYDHALIEYVEDRAAHGHIK